MALADNPLSPSRSKRIYVRSLLVKELIRSREIGIPFVAPGEKLTRIF